MVQNAPLVDISSGGQVPRTSAEIEDWHIMTPIQQGFLFHTLHTPCPGMYIRQMIFSLNERLNIAALQQAWRNVIERHPSLRTSVRLESLDEPVQQVHAKIAVNIEEVDWQGLPPEEWKARLEQHLDSDRRRGFALNQPPLWRLTLFRLGEELYQLALTFHHILSDGFSDVLISRELFANYDAICNGDKLELQEPVPYRAHADWIRSQDFSKAEPYWRELLNGMNIPTPLPMDIGVNQRINGDDVWGNGFLRLSIEITNALNSLAAEHGLTLNTFVQAVWGLLLSRYSGEGDVLFGAVRSCRRSTLDNAGAFSVVGPVINTVPLRVRVTPQTDVISWLKEVRAGWVAIAPYEHTPLAIIQSWAGLSQGSSLFESVVSYDRKSMNTTLQTLNGNWARRELRTIQAGTNYPLTLAAYGENSLLLELRYSKARFDDGSIKQVLLHLERLFVEIASGPGKRLSEINVLTATEREQLQVTWNGSRTAYEKDNCIHELFQRQVAERPASIAIECDNNAISYKEMNNRANQLAHYLKARGVGPETIVGIYLPKSIDVVIAMLGILKSGAAYLPMDPSIPDERLHYMLHSAQAVAVLTRTELAGFVSEGGWSITSLDRDHEEITNQKGDDPLIEVMPENIAYVIYTSGSVGRPKGVMVTHRGVVRLVRGITYLNLNENEVLLQASSPIFDASTLEIWGALLNGGRCVLLNQRIPTAEEIGRAIKENKVSTLVLTTPVYNAVIDDAPDELTGLNQLVIGGEALSTKHVMQGVRNLKGTTLINGYGPTEGTTLACSYKVKGESQDPDRHIPIGRAINNTEIYVLGKEAEIIPVGAVGEIYIGGDGLARGYLRESGLTSEKFLPHPFSKAEGARLYKTGDLARYLADGQIEFLGRRDNQVKIRGHRIELEEIEAMLERCPGVKQSAVVARDEGKLGKRLVAYIVLEEVASLGADEIKKYLRGILPEYMVPSVIIEMKEMPLTGSGKIDRRALPAWDEIKAALQSGTIPPLTSTEQILVNIWREVLGLDQIGVTDNFFELGGHSLLAIRANNRLRQAFNLDFPLNLFFESPTIAALASKIRELREQ